MDPDFASRIDPVISKDSKDSFTDVPGILVIEDNEAVRNLVKLELQNRAFVVWTAASNLEALEQYRQFYPAIDLVVIGVGMPGRDGPETLADLRAFNPHVRACFMTGHSDKYTDQDLLDCGGLCVFLKPFNLNYFFDSIVGFTKPGFAPAG